MSSRLNMWLSCRRVRESGTRCSPGETLLVLPSLCSAVIHRKVHVRPNFLFEPDSGLHRCFLSGLLHMTNCPKQTDRSLSITSHYMFLRALCQSMTKFDTNPDINSKFELSGPDLFRSGIHAVICSSSLNLSHTYLSGIAQ